MKFAKDIKSSRSDTAASASVHADAQARSKRWLLPLVCSATGLLFCLDTLAAVEESKSSLVFVNTRIADREKFDAIIAREFPKAKVLYTSEDANVNDDVRDEVLLGISKESFKQYHSLVIIGDFKNATVPQGALKNWMTDTFALAKKNQAPQLHLLSTSRKPPSTYLCWVEISGGKYRQLKAAPDGSYE